MSGTEEDAIDRLLNGFIEKWLPDYYAHLVDTDENDGQRLRDSLRQALAEARKAELSDLNYWIATNDVAKDCSPKLFVHINGRFVELAALGGKSDE